MTVQTPSSPLVTVSGRPRLTATSVAPGASIRNFARFSELSCGYCWPGATYDMGFQSSLGAGGGGLVWARQKLPNARAANATRGSFDFIEKYWARPPPSPETSREAVF